MTRAVRGAIQVLENSRGAIESASARLVGAMLAANGIPERRIVSIIFSVTHDLDAGNPATGLREAGFPSTPLFCAQEARVQGAMPRVIRALLTYGAPRRRLPVPVYLDGAESLRPDLDHGSRA